MPAQIEAALMAAHVYGNLQSVRDKQNTLPIPEGWNSDVTAHPEFFDVNQTTGFMARAYQKGSDIVISYSGTTDEAGAGSLDWLYGNMPAENTGSGLSLMHKTMLQINSRKDLPL